MSNILNGITEAKRSPEPNYDDPSWDEKVSNVGQKAKQAEVLKSKGKEPKTRWNPETKKYYVDFSDDDVKKESVGLPYPGTYEQTNDMFKSSGQKRIGTLTTEQGVAEGSLEENKGMTGYNAFKREWRAKHGADAKVPAYDSKEYTSYVYRQNDKKQGVAESQHSESCPHCGGEMVSEELMNEKKDACYYKVKSRYKVWPSAYASGALVKCRKKGADSWGNGGKKNESSILEGINRADESLHDWFNKEKWVRMDTKGNIKGPCAKEPGEGKPKCLPQAKAHSLGKKGRASAAARKRREDPNPDRSGKAINVNTKKEK